MLNMFEDFLADPDALEMYVTGPAGSGKTTGLVELCSHCTLHELEYVVCAFTHKACDVLRDALPGFAPIRTLHSYLKKRPTINQEAHKPNHVSVSRKFGDSEKVTIIFIDEYSMVGERDLMDLREMEGVKIVWIGDEHQLPPVGDMQSVVPSGDYCLKLTKIYRQAADNKLLEPLAQLVSFIEGTTPEPLIENESFIRGQDIVEWYDNDRMADNFDGVILAYTNRRVEELNAKAQGYEEPKPGDALFSPTTKKHYTFNYWVDKQYVISIAMPFGEDLELGSKYKTLEHLINYGYSFANVTDVETNQTKVLCSVFGHYQFKEEDTQLKIEATQSNKAIGKEAAQWSRDNRDTPKARKRAKAWRNFLSFNSSVVCLDFSHAMTVHKSQGSTYKTVYLDTQDIGIASEIDYLQYLKLLYVAISRASKYVVTN